MAKGRGGGRWGVMIGVLLLAALLRWTDLPHLPYGLWYDEAYYGLDALGVLGGRLAVFFPENNGREPLFIYLVAGAIAVLGPTPYALRLTASMVGLLAVAATMRMAWTLSRRWAVGALAGALMAFLLWPLHLSRVGFRAGLFPLATALLLHALARAVRTGRPRDWGIAGLVWGGGFYTYLAARMTVIPLAVAGAVRWRRQPGHFPRPAVAAFLGCAFLTLLPLGLFFARHPDHFALRGAQTAAFTGQRPFLAVAGEQAVKVLGMFFVRGDEQPRHNTGRRPVFDPLLALAFGVGGWRAAREAPFTVLWLGAMLLPTFLSTEAPHYLRASGALPVAVFWAALGLWTAAEGFARRLRRPWGVSLLLAAGLGLSFPWHSVAYFDPAWWGRAEVRGAFSLDSWEVAREVRRFLETHPSGTVILSERLWAGRAEMAFLLPDRTRVQVHRVEEEPPAPPPPPALVVGWQHEAPERWRRWLPRDAVLSLEVPPPWPGEGRPRYFLMAADPPGDLRTNLEAAFEDGILLRGGIVRVAGRRITVTLDWEAAAPPSRDYSVFVHVYRRPEGERWPPAAPPIAQHDGGPAGGWYNTHLWRPGDRLRESRVLVLPEEIPAADLAVWVGVYRWEDGRRLRLRTGGEAVRLPVAPAEDPTSGTGGRRLVHETLQVLAGEEGHGDVQPLQIAGEVIHIQGVAEGIDRLHPQVPVGVHGQLGQVVFVVEAVEGLEALWGEVLGSLPAEDHNDYHPIDPRQVVDIV